MQIEDFVKVYQAKSDEELIQLAVAPEQLTSEARLALQGELSRRRVSAAEDSRLAQDDENCHDNGYADSGGKLREQDRQDVGDFVTEVFRSYHSHFWLFFKITAPAVIITTIAIITARNEVREISRHLPRGFEMFTHHTEVLEMWLVNFLAWIVSWLASSVVFGATCIAVEESAAGYSPSAWGSFLNIRQRLAPFLRLSLLLFALVLMAEVVTVLLTTGVFWILHQWQIHTTHLLITVVSYGVVGATFLVLSRFALAIPAVLLDDSNVWPAMFRSDRLTQGKWLTLAALLAKSTIGGYVAAMLPFWLASFVRVETPVPMWFPWILTVASIIGVTVVEPTMFIGFALLYLKTSAADFAPSSALASQLT
jgi:hypothetical protein